MNLEDKEKRNIYEDILIFSTFVIVFLNALREYMQAITSYGIYASIFIWAVAVFMRGKIYIRRKCLYLSIVLLISGLIASVWGNAVLGNVLEEFPRHLSFTVCFFLAVCVRWDQLLSPKMITSFLKALLIVGIIATIYALIFQGKYIPTIMFNSGGERYYDFYKSFFSQRNVYAAFLLLSSFSCIYFYSENKRKVLLLVYAIFVIQMYLASSKASLVSALVFLVLYFFMETRNKFLFILLGAIILIPLVLEVVYPLVFGLSHTTLEGVTSTEIRFSDWESGLETLIRGKAIVFGYGMGSEAIYLYTFRRYGSFHNVYLDLLFQGGLIKLIIYIYSLVIIFKWISMAKDKNFKNVFYAALVTLIIYSTVDSGCMLYSINYHSLLVTVLFSVLPQCNL